MHRSTAGSLIALCAAVVCAAQDAPPPLNTGTDVVRLDLVVRDKRGQPVLDLRQDEIQVSEDGKRREIASVRLIQAGSTASPARPRLVILVFETLGQEGARGARAAATELSSMTFPPDTWFAVARIGPAARLFQSLTSNPAEVRSAIVAATSAPEDGPPVVAGPGSRRPQGSSTPAVGEGSQAELSDLDRVRQGMGAVFDRRLQTPGHPYLVPLRGIVQSLEPVEGRKTVVYFSQGLRLSTRKTFDALAIDAKRTMPVPDRQTLEALVSDANRANVALYSVDVIGLTGLSSTDNSRDIPPPSTVPLDTSAQGPGYDQVDASRVALYSGGRGAPRSLGDLDNLKALAQDTGGFLIAHRKDLSQGFDRVASDLASYYEVTYAMPGPPGDGRFRRIEAKVLRSGASVRTRRGYSMPLSTSPEERAAADVDRVPPPESPATAAVTTPSSDPALATLLERAGQYVSDYEQTFKNLLAEEEYDQSGSNGQRRRSLRSDLLFSSTPGPIPWTCFRDVYEVDGKKVREREARLEKLFSQGTASAVAKAEAIRAESARYNIGSATRNINVPTLALLFLHPQNQGRFRFERRGQRWFSGTPGAEVRFTEVVEPSLVSDGRDDLPGEGRFWIDTNRGTILRSEVTYRFAPNRAYAEIFVEYRPAPGLNIWVPAEMKERYADVPGAWAPVFGSRTTGTARYFNYRRFTVSTEEKSAGPRTLRPGTSTAAAAVLALLTSGSPGRAQTPTFPSGVDLIRIDVVVLDKDGRPVTGLTAADFEITESGTPVLIASFEPVVVRPTAKVQSVSSEPARVSEPSTSEPEENRHFLVFFDDGNVGPVGAAQIRAQLAPFLERETHVGDSVTIVSPARRPQVDGPHGFRAPADPRGGREPAPAPVPKLGHESHDGLCGDADRGVRRDAAGAHRPGPECQVRSKPLPGRRGRLQRGPAAGASEPRGADGSAPVPDQPSWAQEPHPLFRGIHQGARPARLRSGDRAGAASPGDDIRRRPSRPRELPGHGRRTQPAAGAREPH